MRILKYSLLFLFCFIAIQSKSQLKISEINFDRIKYKKVREYLHSQQSNNIQSILDLKPSMDSNSDNKGYRRDERIYLVKDSLAKVWQHYLHTNPGDSWDGGRVSFGVLFSKKENKVIYQGEKISTLDTGQVVYINLRLLRGISNIATVFEMISFDESNKVMEFSYIDGNITKGKQQLFFRETTKGYTEIVHATYFKSNSVIRDYIYPYFHARMINDFHRNMKKLYHSNQEKYVAEFSEPTPHTDNDIETSPGSF